MKQKDEYRSNNEFKKDMKNQTDSKDVKNLGDGWLSKIWEQETLK